MLISEKIDFKPKTVTRNKEGYYIMIKGARHWEDTTINIYMYTPNIKMPNYIKQILTDLRGGIDSNTIVVGRFNTLLSAMGRSSRQKINKETMELTHTLE